MLKLHSFVRNHGIKRYKLGNDLFKQIILEIELLLFKF